MSEPTPMQKARAEVRAEEAAKARRPRREVEWFRRVVLEAPPIWWVLWTVAWGGLFAALLWVLLR